MGRGIDHLVLPVRDIRKARAFYDLLGFTVTPVNWHPFGTMNSLVQFDGSFLEILAVADESAIPEEADDVFSFAGFNRDYLKAREGFSMLVLESRSADADRAAYEGADIRTYAPFRFVRDARLPDGSTRTVAFSLTFISHPDIRHAGFFTCQQHFPQNFWNKDFQTHANGASGISAVVFSAAEPMQLRDFFEAFAGKLAEDDGDEGFSITTRRGTLLVLTPQRVAERFAECLVSAGASEPHFVAAEFTVPSLEGMAQRLADAAIPIETADRMIVVPPGAAFGTGLIFRSG